MRYTFLFLSSLLFSYCSGSKVSYLSSESKLLSEVDRNQSSFNTLPFDTVKLTASYLDANDLVYFRNFNSLTLFSLPLKMLVEQTFNISGLEGIDDNEPELAGVMRMAWTSHDPFLSFAALMEDVAVGKKPYNVLFRPLILHLIQSFRELNPTQKQDYQLNFEFRFQISVDICAMRGYYDLIFEIGKDNVQALRDFVLNFENREELMEIFRANPHYADQYVDTLLSCVQDGMDGVIVDEFGRWMADCIINELPQNYYEGLISLDSIFLEIAISNLCISVNVPESEYSRIHAQIIQLYQNFSGVQEEVSLEFDILLMISDVRFGSFELDDFRRIRYRSLNSEMQRLLTKAALLANKKDIFFESYELYKSLNYGRSIDSIVDFQDLNVNSLQAKCFKMVFEMIQWRPSIFGFESKLFEFISEFYTIRHLEMERDREIVTFEFVLSEKLSEFDFPPVLRIEKQKSRVSEFIGHVLRYMKVVDEEANTAFSRDLANYYNILSITQKVFLESHKLVEFISKYPNLLAFMLEKGIKLEVVGYIQGNLKNYLNLPNFALINQLVQIFSSSNERNLTYLKTDEHLEKMEGIKNATICQLFLKWESNLERDELVAQRGINLVKLLYFEWRMIFAYWIKRYAGDGMQLIRTPEFIEMLKLDFSYETKGLFPPEQS
jgi:hypothetical protein